MKPIPFNKTILEIIPNEYYIIYLSMGMEIPYDLNSYGTDIIKNVSKDFA